MLGDADGGLDDAGADSFHLVVVSYPHNSSDSIRMSGADPKSAYVRANSTPSHPVLTHFPPRKGAAPAPGRPDDRHQVRTNASHHPHPFRGFSEQR